MTTTNKATTEKIGNLTHKYSEFAHYFLASNPIAFGYPEYLNNPERVEYRRGESGEWLQRVGSSFVPVDDCTKLEETYLALIGARGEQILEYLSPKLLQDFQDRAEMRNLSITAALEQAISDWMYCITKEDD